MNSSLSTAFTRFVRSLRQASIGIVYSYQPPDGSRDIWYDRWRSDVLTTYGNALQALGAEPLYMDVQTFCEHALAGRLSALTAVFNLNAGITPISNWALVPAIAQWSNLPVLPCDADLIVLGERKDLSNLVAREFGLKTPREFTSENLVHLPDQMPIVEKPRDLGGSAGIRVLSAIEASTNPRPRSEVIYQEFISGYDLTLPVVANPLTGRLAALPAVCYVPDSEPPTSWYHSRDTKLSGSGYSKTVIHLPEEKVDWLVRLAEFFDIRTYCRLDIRLGASTKDCLSNALANFDCYFMEINPMPTIRLGINFLDATEHLLDTDELLASMHFIRSLGLGNPSYASSAWLLACALFAKLEPSVVNNRDKPMLFDESTS